jgi:ABC-type lipoprotein release transport system permease subunit
MNGTVAIIAWRNIWRNRRRTLITLTGIVFGVFLSVLFTAMGDGSYSQMIDYAAKLGGGHVTVQHEDFGELPSLKKTVRDTQAVRRSAESNPGVLRTVPRISGATMLATASNSFGAFFIAVDPEREDAETLTFLDALSEGEMFESADEEGVILGAKLASNLDLELGKKVVYTMTDRDGEIVSNLARVTGIVRTGAATVDGGLCLLPIDTVRRFIGYEPDEVTQFAIFVKDHREARAVVETLHPVLPAGSVALDWEQTQPDLAGFIGMKMASTWIMEVIIMSLLAAGIFNTLFVSVMERLREFGIMTALGFSPRQLFGLVMWESFWLGLVGLVAAALFTAGPYAYLSIHGIDYSSMIPDGTEVVGVAVDPILRVSIYGEHVFAIAVLVVIATLASGLYPAWRAGRVPPADAIRLV